MRMDSRKVFSRPPLNYNIGNIQFLRENPANSVTPPRGCTVRHREALDVILDDSFRLSDGESSDEEAVEQFYAHTGDPVFARSDVEALTREIVDDGMDGDFDHEYSCVEENKSDISCLKNQPDAFPVQYTKLSLGQAIKLQL